MLIENLDSSGDKFWTHLIRNSSENRSRYRENYLYKWVTGKYKKTNW